ncbi:uncharacterized protein LODBEIA_P21450 [Lodderomyces beijingensis]|uniref:Uncharacterized protein n=1 Tax=Lodderomyces beijingensis TaxID=1775926 RepID=A0ABP0ZM01_9ASCO
MAPEDKVPLTSDLDIESGQNINSSHIEQQQQQPQGLVSTVATLILYTILLQFILIPVAYVILLIKTMISFSSSSQQQQQQHRSDPLWNYMNFYLGYYITAAAVCVGAMSLRCRVDGMPWSKSWKFWGLISGVILYGALGVTLFIFGWVTG